MAMAMDMETKTLDNDTRGWIMCFVSGIGTFNGFMSYTSRAPTPV